MNDHQRNPVEELFEQYLVQCRACKRPTIESFASRHPEFAAEILELFPALELLEDIYRPNRPPVAKPTDEDNVGQTFGDYELLRIIGQGGMGVVYHARHRSLGKEVAIKVLPQQMASETYRRRFLREARSAARLHHSNIVPVFDFGEQDGRYYYVMQYIRGQSLATLLKASNLRTEGWEDRQLRMTTALSGVSNPTNATADATTPKSGRTDAEHSLSSGIRSSSVRHQPKDYWHHVASVGLQVAEGLDYAHSQQILHRDIKPGNLLLDEKGTVWITDFGLAKSDEDDDLTQTGDIIGTLRYLPPEALNGRTDRRSDICSLGLTLYELAAHRPAYTQQGRHQLLRQISDSSPSMLRTVCSGVPYDLETIIHKSIEREPANRYRSARALADDLRRFINHQTIKARQTSWLGILARWGKRNPALAAVTSVLALSLLTISIVSPIVAIHLAVAKAKAEESTQNARKAERDAKRALFDSSIVAARSAVLSRKPGQRLDALQAIRQAESLLPEVDVSHTTRFEIRNLAINALSRVDVTPCWQKEFKQSLHNDFAICPEADLYAHSDGWPSKTFTLRRISDDSIITTTPDEIDQLYAMQFNPTNRLFAATCTISGEAKLQVWRLINGNLVRHFERPILSVNWGYVFDIAHPDYCACIRPSGALEIISTDSGKTLRQFDLRVNGVRMAANGNKALAWPKKVKSRYIVDVKSGTVSEQSSPLIRDAAIRSDGRVIVVTRDRNVEVFDTATNQKTTQFYSKSIVSNLSIHPDGKLFATDGWDGVVRLWDASGEHLLSLQGHVARFSADGRYLTFRQANGIAYAKIALPECRRSLAINRTQQFYGAAIHPSGLLVLGGDSRVLFYDLIHDQLLNSMVVKGQGVGVYGLADGSAILTTGASGVIEWPVSRKEQRCIVGPPKLVELDADTEFGRIVGTANDSTLAVGGYDHISVLRKKRNAWQSKSISHPGETTWVALSPDGTKVATGGNKQARASVYDAVSGEQLATFSYGGVPLFDSGARLLLSSNYDSLLVDTKTWHARRFPFPISEPIPAISRKRNILPVGRLDQGCLALFDLRTLKTLAHFPPIDDSAHEIPVYVDEEVSVLFGCSPGGYISEETSRLAIWDLKTLRKELADLNLDWGSPPIERSTLDFTDPPDAIEIEYFSKALTDVRTDEQTGRVVFEAPYLNSIARTEGWTEVRVTCGFKTPENGPRWSGETTFNWGAKKGEQLYLEVDVPEAREYRLRASLDSATTHGTFRVSVNGQEVGSTLENSKSKLTLISIVELGRVELSEGKNSICIRNVGASKASMSIDHLSLEPVGSSIAK